MATSYVRAWCSLHNSITTQKYLTSSTRKIFSIWLMIRNKQEKKVFFNSLNDDIYNKSNSQFIFSSAQQCCLCLLKKKKKTNIFSWGTPHLATSERTTESTGDKLPTDIKFTKQTTKYTGSISPIFLPLL